MERWNEVEHVIIGVHGVRRRGRREEDEGK